MGLLHFEMDMDLWIISCPPKICMAKLTMIFEEQDGGHFRAHCPYHRTPAFRYGKSACIKICMAKHDPIHIHSPVVDS